MNRTAVISHYRLRTSVHFDDGPVALTTVDRPLTRGRFAIAVSDLGARCCSPRRAGGGAFIIINGRARPSNTVRFVDDSVG
jgi:hypothetical protein